MPKLNDDTMESFPNVGTYGFSATRLDDLGASSFTLVSILVDTSGSVYSFKDGITKALKEVIRSCQKSPRADNLMIRLCTFNSTFNEVHGFKLLQNINLDDYNDVIKPSGMTMLFDTVVNGLEATIKYGKDLASNDFQTNAILFVITDGADNESKLGPVRINELLKEAVSSEALESMVSILIGVNVNDSSIAQYLQDFNTKAGFTQYIELDNADSKTLARLAEFVSKSISSTSQSLGSGTSQTLTF